LYDFTINFPGFYGISGPADFPAADSNNFAHSINTNRDHKP
jgi:hypothetical protein